MIKYNLGLIRKWNFSVSEKDLETFSNLSGDLNPVHLNDAFAMKKGFKSRIVYGALLSTQVSKLIGQMMPDDNLIILGFVIDFLKPTYLNDEIIFEAKLVEKNQSVSTLVFNFFFIQNQIKTCKGRVEAVWKK